MTTALPAKNIFDGSATPSTSTMKTALGQLRDFLAERIGADAGAGVGSFTDIGVSGTAGIGQAVDATKTIASTRTSTTASTQYGMHNTLTHTANAIAYGFKNEVTHSGTTSGAAIKNYITHAGTSNRDHIIGLDTWSIHSSTGTIGSIYGVGSYIQTGAGCGAVTEFSHFHAKAPVIDGSSGTITSAYGLYVESQTNAKVVQPYAIYTAGPEPVLFGGKFIAQAGESSITESGTQPAVSSGTVLSLVNSGSASDVARLNIVSGNAGYSIIEFSDTDANQRGGLTYAHGTDKLLIIAGGATVAEASSSALAVNGDISVSTKTPASAGDAGVAGTITWDANYIYVCTATNTWKRVAIASW